MISYIKGRIVQKAEDHIVLEAGPIGYNINVASSLPGRLPAIGSEVCIYTYLDVKEDSLTLYGFATRDEEDVFRLLIGVSGIGPKGAQAILSVLTPSDLRIAVASSDAKRIAKAQGVGMKTAQRVIIDLKDKLKLEDAFTDAGDTAAVVADGSKEAQNDAVQALVSLGYSASESLQAVVAAQARAAAKGETLDDTESLLKAALRQIALI